MMEIEKLRSQSGEELILSENSAAEQLFRLRFQKSLGNQDGIKKIRVLRLDIARAKTIARERVIAADREKNPVALATAPAKSTRTERKQALKGKA